MHIIDLTHLIHGKMPVFYGAAAPECVAVSTLEQHGYVESRVSVFSHTGTHIDAPGHILDRGRFLDELPAERFVGPVVVVDVTKIGKRVIEKQDLEPYAPVIAGADFVLMHTGWSKYWGDDRYLHGFPSLTETAVRWLLTFSLKGVGVDAISIDAEEAVDYPVHRLLLEREVLIIENLTKLDALPTTGYILSVLPLKVVGSDGLPVRAVAMSATAEKG